MMPLSRRCLLTGAATPLLASAAARWTKPFPDWDQAAVDKLLTDSAWAKSQGIKYRLPFQTAAGVGSILTELNLTVRWASALPVRQATALALGLQHRVAKRLLAVEQPAGYAIEVAGFPVSAALPAALRAGFEKTAQLVARDGSTRRAVTVDVPEHGMHLMAEVRFPAEPLIEARAEWVEFVAEPLAGLKVRTRFALATMQYEGKLAL